MIQIKSVLLAVLLCASLGCRTVGPASLQQTHPQYNHAISRSLDEQFLEARHAIGRRPGFELQHQVVPFFHVTVGIRLALSRTKLQCIGHLQFTQNLGHFCKGFKAWFACWSRPGCIAGVIQTIGPLDADTYHPLHAPTALGQNKHGLQRDRRKDLFEKLVSTLW